MKWLAFLFLTAVCFGQNAPIVVVGNQGQPPLQFATPQPSILQAIQKAGPYGQVWIPASYTGGDCNPVSTCNPGSLMILDFRNGTFTPSASGGSAAAVSSVFTRTGAVVATSGDYTCSQVTNCPTLSGTGLVRQTGAATELSQDVTTSGSNAATVVGINNTLLSGLATGILYNTTITGVPSIASSANILAACSGCAPLSSPSFTTPALGAATATSLLATGIVDGTAPVTITTGTTGTPGSTYNSGYTFNQEATAGTGVTYTLPVPAAGKQYCVKNSYNGSAANTGILTIAVATPGTHFIIKNGTKGSSTGTLTSGGAAGDAACVVGISSTLWEAYVQVGTWTLN
jgi:hypothetical protein